MNVKETSLGKINIDIINENLKVSYSQKKPQQQRCLRMNNRLFENVQRQTYLLLLLQLVSKIIGSLKERLTTVANNKYEASCIPINSLDHSATLAGDGRH